MWQDSYAIGVETIDAQHKGLFEYVGRLLEELGHEVSYHDRRHEIDEALGVLKHYTLEHFATEEEYQLSIGYSGYKAHKIKHEKIKRDLANFETELIASNYDTDTVKRFLGFLLAWLIFHVVQDDSDIRRDRNRQKAALSGEYAKRLADRTKEVLEVFAAIDNSNMETSIVTADSGIASADCLCYKVNLIGGLGGNNLGVIFSERFAIGALQSMTGKTIDLHQTDKVTLSVFDGVLSTVAGKIAHAIAEEGAAYGVGTPGIVDASTLPDGGNGFRLATALGDVTVVVF